MSRKKLPDNNRFVFSTNPNFKYNEELKEQQNTLPPNQQKLTVKLDTKHRAGKAVTLIQGFVGKEDDLNLLGKQLKNFCGTGGSVKDGEIIIQGDQRDKILQWLQKNSYINSKRIG